MLRLGCVAALGAAAAESLQPATLMSERYDGMPDHYVLARGGPRSFGDIGSKPSAADIDCNLPCKGLHCPDPYVTQGSSVDECTCKCVMSRGENGKDAKPKDSSISTEANKAAKGAEVGADETKTSGEAKGKKEQEESGAKEEPGVNEESGAKKGKEEDSDDLEGKGSKSGKASGEEGAHRANKEDANSSSAPTGSAALAARVEAALNASKDPYQWEYTNSSSRRPNVILWVTDDQGWANVGYHNPHVHTPTMDQLAREGVMLERHYTACWCVPSRASVMTGRLPYHLLQNGGELIPEPIEMLPAVMKKAGYSTAMVGKWHLGNFREWQLPTSRGFDRMFGFLGAAADYYTHEADATAWPCDGIDLWADHGPAMSRNKGDLISTKMHALEASAVITQHANNKHSKAPLFMYVALQAMHSPQPNPPVNTDLYNNFTTDFAIANGLISAADEALYDVTKTLRAQNMWSDTLIIHTADNGGSVSPLLVEVRGTNFPLRGGKNTNFDGGVRVPAFLTGGFVPNARRGKTLRGYVHLADWYTTIISLAGMRLAADSVEPDGIDMWPYIAGYGGASDNTSPRSEIVLSTASKKMGSVDALIMGQYKLILGKPLCDGYTTEAYPENNTLTKTLNCNPAGNSPDGVGASTWLFDLVKDPSEKVNIAPLYAHKVADMTAVLEERRVSEVKYSDPDSWAPDAESKCKAYVASHHGFLGPFMP